MSGSRFLSTRLWVQAAAITVALVAVTACSGGDNATENAAASCEPAGGQVNLSFWNWVPGMDDAVKLWNSENPDIQVKLNNVPAGNAGTYQKMFNALRAGNAPDLGQVEFDSLASFRLNDGLADIGRCAGVREAGDKFVPWTWNQVTFGSDASVYGIPQDIGPLALYYRKDLFDRHKIPVPKTWEDYYQAAVTLKKAEPKSVITHFSQTDPNWFTGLLWQNGARLFAEDGDQWTVDVDGGKAKPVADYWQRLIDEKLVATDLQGFSPALYKAWNDGSVATWISAPWGYSIIRDNAPAAAGKWAVAPLPQWSAGGTKVGNWGGSTTAVFSSSKHPHEAAKFAVWLNTDPDALAILNAKGGQYAAARAGQQLPALSGPVPYYGDQQIFDVFEEAAGQVDVDFTWGPTMTDTYRFMSDGISSALAGNGTLGDALAATQKKTVASLEAQSLRVAK